MMVLACVLAVVLSAAPLARGFAMLGLGGMLGLIGTAGPDGLPRFTFGQRALF